jgi:glycerophosphoryl diester phosphodiesterase
MNALLAHLLLCVPLAAGVFERGAPQMMCHRTANRDVPENTLASLEESARLGCNIVELDIARSLDGQLVLLHDGPIDRISSGSGIVEKIVADELFLYDAGAWMNPRFAGLKAPLFADALRTARKAGLRLVLDYKSEGIHPQVAPLLAEEGMAERVRYPGQPGAEPTALWKPGMTRAEVAALQAQGKFVIASFSANPHELNLAMMKEAVAAGVDVVNTDHPRLAAEALGRPIEPQVAALVAQARQGDLTAVSRLSRYRDFNLTPHFLAWLASPNPALSRAAAVALVTARRPNAVASLRQALPHPNAAWALGMFPAPEAVGDLTDALAAARDPHLQFELLLALSRLPGRVDPALIAPHLTSPSPLVAGAAALAAARHAGPRAASMVETAAVHLRAEMARFQQEYPNTPGIRPPQPVIDRSLGYYRGYQKAAAALALVGGQTLEAEAVRPAADMSSMGPLVAAYQLWSQPAAVPALLRALASPDAATRDRAQWTLIKLDDAAGPQIRAAFSQASPALRLLLADVLAWRGDRLALPLLQADGETYRWAITKIGQFPTP